MSTIQRALQIFSNFIFPPICLNCSSLGNNGHFCNECVLLLEPLEPLFRCKHCFQEMEKRWGLCECCLKEPKRFYAFSFVFENIGPAEALTKEIKKSPSPALIKAAAGYLVYQIFHLSWEKADLISFLPEPLPVKLLKSADLSRELAKKTADILKIPFQSLIDERMEGLFTSKSVLKKKGLIADKKILLISLQNQKKQHEAIESLLKGFPKKIYHLSFLDFG